MEATAYIKHIRVSPKKLRFIIADIKKRRPLNALAVLSLSQKHNAKILYKAINSAVNNAKAIFKTDGKELRFKTLLVEEGPFLKRMRAVSRGRAHFYKKRSSHIKVALINEGIKSATVLPSPKIKKSVVSKVNKKSVKKKQ